MNAKKAKKLRKMLKVYDGAFGIEEETSYTINRVGVVQTAEKSKRNLYQRTKEYIKQSGTKEMWGGK